MATTEVDPESPTLIHPSKLDLEPPPSIRPTKVDPEPVSSVLSSVPRSSSTHPLSSLHNARRKGRATEGERWQRQQRGARRGRRAWMWPTAASGDEKSKSPSHFSTPPLSFSSSLRYLASSRSFRRRPPPPRVGRGAGTTYWCLVVVAAGQKLVAVGGGAWDARRDGDGRVLLLSPLPLVRLVVKADGEVSPPPAVTD
uniref:Uncharacterized protein n=1 Tax=Oryza punctata TaxID=4537 RepID=A0A0E0K1Y4_ORYPU